MKTIFLILLLSISSIACTDDDSDNSTRLYTETFDYISNGVLTGTANDETVFEISKSSLARANLTVLLDWMQWLEDMQAQVQESKKNVEPNDFDCYIHMDKLNGEHNKEERVDTMLCALKFYQEELETELRKPEKSWNYPKN